MESSTKKILVYGGVALAVTGLGIFLYFQFKDKATTGSDVIDTAPQKQEQQQPESQLARAGTKSDKDGIAPMRISKREVASDVIKTA